MFAGRPLSENLLDKGRVANMCAPIAPIRGQMTAGRSFAKNLPNSGRVANIRQNRERYRTTMSRTLSVAPGVSAVTSRTR